MSQLVFIMRRLVVYVQTHNINTDFTKALEACVRLTQGVPEVEIDAYGDVARDVARWLVKAYRAYRSDGSRPLPYAQYDMFIRVCHGWGSFMNDVQMTRWHQETEDEYERAKKLLKTRAPAQTRAEPQTDAERMKELLAKLRKLLESYDE